MSQDREVVIADQLPEGLPVVKTYWIPTTITITEPGHHVPQQMHVFQLPDGRYAYEIWYVDDQDHVNFWAHFESFWLIIGGKQFNSPPKAMMEWAIEGALNILRVRRHQRNQADVFSMAELCERAKPLARELFFRRTSSTLEEILCCFLQTRPELHIDYNADEDWNGRGESAVTIHGPSKVLKPLNEKFSEGLSFVGPDQEHAKYEFQRRRLAWLIELLEQEKAARATTTPEERSTMHSEEFERSFVREDDEEDYREQIWIEFNESISERNIILAEEANPKFEIVE